MMDDHVAAIDTRTFEVSRRFSVVTGSEMALEGYEVGEVVTGARVITRAAQSGGNSERMRMQPTCSPTWAQPTPDGKSVFVACNKGNEILVIDRESWTLERKFPSGPTPYNLGITPDGRVLVASLKSAGQVQFFDAATGESLAIVP